MLSVALPYCAMNEKKNEVFIMSGAALAKLELKETKGQAVFEVLKRYARRKTLKGDKPEDSVLMQMKVVEGLPKSYES